MTNQNQFCLFTSENINNPFFLRIYYLLLSRKDIWQRRTVFLLSALFYLSTVQWYVLLFLLSFWLCPREWSQTVLCLSTLQVQHLVTLLSEVEPKLADMIKKDFLVSSNASSWTGPEPLFDNKCNKNCIYGKTCTLQKFAYCTVCISMCLWPRFLSKLNIF